MRRRGYTLTELLFVLAIIGLLLGLTIPAVLYARESARRAQCQNNLAQIGQALHDHHSAHGRFPEAVPSEDGSERSSGPLNPPQVALLPFLEQPALFGEIDPRYGGGHLTRPPFQPPALSVVPVYVCPSDPVEGGNNYRDCTGPDPYAVPTSWVDSGESGRGPFVAVKRISAAAITDGLSNTVGFGEKRKSDADANRFDHGTEVWYTSLSNVLSYPPAEEMVKLCGSLSGEPTSFHGHVGATWAYVGYFYTLYNHVVTPNAALADCEANGWTLHVPPQGGVYKAGSDHRGGVNCLLMDGAVRFIANDVDLVVWQAISTRAGGETETAF